MLARWLCWNKLIWLAACVFSKGWTKKTQPQLAAVKNCWEKDHKEVSAIEEIPKRYDNKWDTNDILMKFPSWQAIAQTKLQLALE